MVPLSLLRYEVVGQEVVPIFLGEHDHGWLRGLLDEYERFVGRPRWQLRQRLADPGSFEPASWRLSVASHVLDELWDVEVDEAVSPRAARSRLFGAAAAGRTGTDELCARVAAELGVAAATAGFTGTRDEPCARVAAELGVAAATAGFTGTRDELCARVAAELGVSAATLEEALFADLPDQCRLAELREPISPLELALRTNLAIAQSLIRRASAVRIHMIGRARDVVRIAKLQGLVCTVLPGDDRDAAILEVSGPLALFRRTTAYGRALGSLLPRLAWCKRFQLRADCLIGDLPRTLVLRSGDPIFPAPEPPAFDSKLERRFARELSAAALDWDLIREPEPVPVAGTLVFPDFALQHRHRPARRWLVEIAGFWTAAYLVEKLRRLREARLDNLILCIDETRNCAAGDLPPGARVVRFAKGRIDPAAILRIIAPDATPRLPGLPTSSAEAPW